MIPVTSVYVVVPDCIHDPARPSGGNAYDRRVCEGLTAIGWSVHECAVPGAWPRPDAAARAILKGVLAAIPRDAVVLLDGLIASTVPELLVAEKGRLRIVVLVHTQLGDGVPGVDVECARSREGEALSAADAIVATSIWTRTRLLDRYPLQPWRVHVAEPGVDVVDLAPGTATGGQLLSVAAVTPDKGHDVLLAALATIADLAWRCVCVGPLDREPDFVHRLERQAGESGIKDRVQFTGPLAGADLDGAYAAADVLVLASRAETYGMVVTEALARGLPVVATAVGGVPEALGRLEDGSRPGLLVPPDDPTAFAAALRSWLEAADSRRRLRGAAQERRTTLVGWSTTSHLLSRILDEVTA
ncbi:MAG: glycosyltransferase [Nocardioides sp.]|nr:glycosyltransferase [Nocardioides sp.]